MLFRSIPQAKALKAMLNERGTDVTVMLDLQVEEEELIKRLLERGKISGRSDDNLETIKSRLEVYHNQTAPLVIASDGEINPSKYVSHKVYVKNVRFSSSKKVKDTLSFAKFERVKNNFASEPDLQTKRLNRIIEWLKIKDGICTSDVMYINNCSSSTVTKDLNKLCSEGIILKRTKGFYTLNI